MLDTIAIRENKRFSTGRAVAVLIIPLAVLVGVGILAFLLLVAAIYAGAVSP